MSNIKPSQAATGPAEFEAQRRAKLRQRLLTVIRERLANNQYPVYTEVAFDAQCSSQFARKALQAWLADSTVVIPEHIQPPVRKAREQPKSRRPPRGPYKPMDKTPKPIPEPLEIEEGEDDLSAEELNRLAPDDQDPALPTQEQKAREQRIQQLRELHARRKT